MSLLSDARRVSFLPSLLTLGNFSCGFLSIVFCLNALYYDTLAKASQMAGTSVRILAPEDVDEGNALVHPPIPEADDYARRAARLLRLACYMIFLGMCFDVLDGRVARMTGTESRFGGELDSLADSATFGIAPGAVMATFWVQIRPDEKSWWGQVMIFGLVYAACAALRLARYNVETGGDRNYFKGLPSPAAAGCVASAALVCVSGYPSLTAAWDAMAGMWGTMAGWFGMRGDTRGDVWMVRMLALYTLAIGLLMVSRFRFVHFANRYIGGRRRFTSLVLAVFALALLWKYPVLTLFAAFNGYVVVCLAAHVYLRARAKRQTPGTGDAPVQ